MTKVAMVGDSLTQGTLPYQADEFAKIGMTKARIDAYKSRGIRTKIKADQHTGLTAVDAIRAVKGDSDVWVVALGTNDATFYREDKIPEVIEQMMDRIGRGHYVMWINVYMPSEPTRQDAWNSALAAVAKDRPDVMFIHDWASLAAQNPQWMARDQIHYLGKGYAQRATATARALKALVPSTPPLNVSQRPYLRLRGIS